MTNRWTTLLPWTQRALFGIAFLLLGYCAFMLTGSWMFQRTARANLASLVVAQNEQPTIAVAPPAPAEDGLIGSIAIERLGLSAVVAEGATEDVLHHAAGHIPGTALPGEAGNIGIAAHRDTFFRPLRNVRRNDAIVLTTTRGTFRYRVVSTEVVTPDDTQVLDRDPDTSEILTLVTCYPFYYVGPAPNRFIVRAERVSL